MALKKKKRQYKHDFTSKICWKRLNPISLEEISRGTGRAVPGVYTDRYQVLPGHRGLTALPWHGTRIELMIPQINHILTFRNKSNHTYRKVIFHKLIMQGETVHMFSRQQRQETCFLELSHWMFYSVILEWPSIFSQFWMGASLLSTVNNEQIITMLLYTNVH